MPDESQVRELQAIIQDVKEQLSFLNELGIEGADVCLDAGLPAPDSKDPLPKEANSTTSKQVDSFRRNATAATTQPADPVLKSGIPPNFGTDALFKSDSMEGNSISNLTPAASPPETPNTLFDSIMSKEVINSTRVAEVLEDVWNDTRDCTRCVLCEGRTHVVNSEGNHRAQLMFVGEAPGADEDAQARPFVGRAGQLLNKIIESIGLRREDVFIGNVNRCRPPQNRTPTPAEGAICKPFILREIDIVKPKVIVVLGNVAMKNLLDTKEGITKLRGKFQDYRGIKVMPTFHPAYLLRDPSKKRETWEDMKTVRDYLNSLAVKK